MDFPADSARPWLESLPWAIAPEAWRGPLRAQAERLGARFAERGLSASIVFEPAWVRGYAEAVARETGGKAWSPLSYAVSPCAALVLHNGARVHATIGARLMWIEGALGVAMRRWPEAPNVGPDLAADIVDRHVVWLGALWRDPVLQGQGLGQALTEAMAIDALCRWRFSHLVGVRRDRGLLALEMAPFRRLEAPLTTGDGGTYALVAAARAQVRALFAVSA